MALGQQIYEGKGRQVPPRVLSDGKLEVSEQLNGRFLGQDGVEFSTVINEMRPDGSLFGEVNGVFMSRDGQGVRFRGQGVGGFRPDGGVSFRGAVYYWSGSQKFAQSNRTVGVFEVESDAAGNVEIKAWAWT
jgi:hypothetical protein